MNPAALNSRRALLQLLVAAGVGGFARPSRGQQGGRTLKLVVPTSPGSSADIGARAVAEHIQRTQGRVVVIENKVGAGGKLAADAVVLAPPDGETIALLGNSYLLYPVEFPQSKFDPLTDLAPVAMISRGANVLVVAAASPYQKLDDLVRKSRAAPGQLNFASAGLGSSTYHSAMHLLTAAKLEMTHVPMKGSPEAVTEVMSSRVDFAFAPIPVASSLMKSGRIRALAVSPSKRSALLLNIPTTVEAGVPGSSYESWLVALAPAKTPATVQADLNKMFNSAVESTEVQQLFSTSGTEPFQMPLAELQVFVRQEYAAAMAHEKMAPRR